MNRHKPGGATRVDGGVPAGALSAARRRGRPLHLACEPHDPFARRRARDHRLVREGVDHDRSPRKVHAVGRRGVHDARVAAPRLDAAAVGNFGGPHMVERWRGLCVEQHGSTPVRDVAAGRVAHAQPRAGQRRREGEGLTAVAAPRARAVAEGGRSIAHAIETAVRRRRTRARRPGEPARSRADGQHGLPLVGIHHASTSWRQRFVQVDEGRAPRPT